MKIPPAIPAIRNWHLLGKSFLWYGRKKKLAVLWGETCHPVLVGRRFTGSSRDSRSSRLLTVGCIIFAPLSPPAIANFLISGKKGGILTARVQRDAGAAVWLFGDV